MTTLKNWQNEKEQLEQLGVQLPKNDVEAAKEAGRKQPHWIHFGGGNLYRAFHAQVAQDLLDQGLEDRGVVVVETFSPFTIDHVYGPFNCDSLEVVMEPDGTLNERILSSTADGVFANPAKNPAGYARVKAYFESPELQLATFTITEKGYALKNAEGEFFPFVAKELEEGPEHAASTMGIVAALLLARFNAGATPVAMASTDNFSQNGRRFQEAVLTVVKGWLEHGKVSQAFVDWVSDESKVSFPWSMIDRITPNPSPETEEALKKQGFTDLAIEKSENGPAFSGFANTEEAHYLVVEDSFPNGRPALEKGGVIMTDRDTAEKADTMKVTACLNPLHTCLAVYGCVLGYTRIWQEMEDADLVALIKRLGYDEDLPVVVDPKVIDPHAFIEELLTKRLPNKALPDAPQRIASDTSQKVAIRYGHTLNAYAADPAKDPSKLTYIPLVIAGWLRYLLAVDDEGKEFTCSPDPLLDELQQRLAGIKLGETDAAKVHDAVQPILSNTSIFDCDLYQLGLGEKIEGMFLEELAGAGAVRATIKKYLA